MGVPVGCPAGLAGGRWVCTCCVSGLWLGSGSRNGLLILGRSVVFTRILRVLDADVPPPAHLDSPDEVKRKKTGAELRPFFIG